jgi:hypothetical protein
LMAISSPWKKKLQLFNLFFSLKEGGRASKPFHGLLLDISTLSPLL